MGFFVFIIELKHGINLLCDFFFLLNRCSMLHCSTRHVTRRVNLF